MAEHLILECRTRSEQRALNRLLSPDTVSEVSQPRVARKLGWTEHGIIKGSFAAKTMSLEKRHSGGRLWNV